MVSRAHLKLKYYYVYNKQSSRCLRGVGLNHVLVNVRIKKIGGASRRAVVGDEVRFGSGRTLCKKEYWLYYMEHRFPSS